MRMMIACMICCLSFAYADETGAAEETAAVEEPTQGEVAEDTTVDSLRAMVSFDCGCNKGKKK